MKKALKILAGYVEFFLIGIFRFYRIGKFHGLPLRDFLHLVEKESVANLLSPRGVSQILNDRFTFRLQEMSGETFEGAYGHAQSDDCLIEGIAVYFHGGHGYLSATFHDGLVCEWRLNSLYRLPKTTTRYERWALRQIRHILRDNASRWQRSP
jgi:hypothetical protein